MRRFLVARQGQTVVIREVTPGTSLVEHDRESAWAFAQRLAQPVKRGINKRPTSDILFTALDGTSRSVEPTK